MQFLSRAFLFFSFLIFFTVPLARAQPADLQVASATCGYRYNPLAIDDPNPKLGWELSSHERGQRQSGYEIVVSDNPEDSKNLKGNVWSSGRVNSRETIQIAYQGKDLQPYTRYFWRVRVYDNQNSPSPWSCIYWFETAALDASQWKGSWISDGKIPFTRDSDFYKNDPSPIFKKAFRITKKVIAARLYISGLGYYQAWLNGRQIGNNMLDPGFTPYRKTVLYSTYDVTAQCLKGNNVIAVVLGNGWYNPLPLRMFGAFNFRNILPTGRPCLNAQLCLQYSDGSMEWHTTDHSWKCSTSHILFNSVYLGEHDDGTLMRDDFLNNDFSNWDKVKVVDGPKGHLTAQQQPPIRITKTITPVSIRQIGKDTFIVDMGQNFAGVAQIQVKGPAGTKVKLRYGEALFADGRLNFLTSVAGQIKSIWHINGGPGAPPTAWQEDTYVLRGKGVETWSPTFTYHGFRYIEVTGWPGNLGLNDIKGLRMNADLEQDGSFTCSNQLLNRLHEVIQWTFLSNVFSVQSDCPAREKLGYGADMVVTAPSFCYNYNMATFYAKSIADFAGEQQADGGITETAPYVGINSESPGGESGPLGWQLAFAYLQNQLYEFYGNKNIIAAYYPAILRQMQFLETKAVDHLYDHDIGDHAAIDPKPVAFDASLFYYHHAILARHFAHLLNKTVDSLHFSVLADNIRRAVKEKYEFPNTGRYDNATQGAQLFALAYGLPEKPELAFEVLLNEFRRHQYHVSTGIFSTQMLFGVLSDLDENDLAFKIATQHDYPGWGYMLGKNATTLWESWDYPDNSGSQNHPMFGSIDQWFYRSLLGIRPAQPGFTKIIIKPQPAGDLTWASGNYHSVSGNILSDWKLKGDTLLQHVVIPPNTTADIYFPCNNDDPVSENGKVVSGIKGFIIQRYDNHYKIITVGSGEYHLSGIRRTRGLQSLPEIK